MSDQYNQGESNAEYKQHPDMSREALDEACYFTSTANPTMRMIRPDGVNIVFRDRIFKCEVEGDAEYLEKELKGGHRHFRKSTPEEIREYGLRTDPINTIRAEAMSDEGLRSQMLEAAKKQLQEQLKAGEVYLDEEGNLISKLPASETGLVSLEGGEPTVTVVGKPEDKLAALKNKLVAEQHPDDLSQEKLKPVSTADLGKNIAG